MTSEEIMASITWHCAVVRAELNAAQLWEHEWRGACSACEHRTPLSKVLVETSGAP